MLHTLWILFKFILILLAIIFGLFLAVILLILFCPIHYQAAASKKEDSFQNMSAAFRLSWLFGAVSLRCKIKNQHSRTSFYLFGLPLKKPAGHPKKKAKPSSSEPGEIPHQEPPKSTTAHTAGISSPIQEEESCSSKFQSVKKRGEEFFFRLGKKCRTSLDRIRLLYKDIKFLNTSQTRKAVSFVKMQLIKLLKHVFPTKITGKLIFGCADPSVTGSILAVLGMTMPFHKNCLAVTPVFEDQNILKGHIRASGRIYGIVLAEIALKLYFNQNIKYIIKKWKHRRTDYVK